MPILAQKQDKGAQTASFGVNTGAKLSQYQCTMSLFHANTDRVFSICINSANTVRGASQYGVLMSLMCANIGRKSGQYGVAVSLMCANIGRKSGQYGVAVSLMRANIGRKSGQYGVAVSLMCANIGRKYGKYRCDSLADTSQYWQIHPSMT